MIEQKSVPSEGEDGKLYFNYPLHAVYTFKSSEGQTLFVYEILDCEYTDGEERYELACNGAPLAGKKSLDQVNLIFGFFDYDITDPGERAELPLLPDEVRQYYEDKAKDLGKANAEANAALKGTDYFKLKSAIESLSRPLRFAKSQGDSARAAELNARINELSAQQYKIIQEKGVDVDILKKTCRCKICYDSGFTDDGNICGCALERADEIKIYNAELRLARRK